MPPCLPFSLTHKPYICKEGARRHAPHCVNWLEAEQARRRLHIGKFVAVEGRLDLSVEWLRKFFRFRTFARVGCCARSVKAPPADAGVCPAADRAGGVSALRPAP